MTTTRPCRRTSPTTPHPSPRPRSTHGRWTCSSRRDSGRGGEGEIDRICRNRVVRIDKLRYLDKGVGGEGRSSRPPDLLPRPRPNRMESPKEGGKEKKATALGPRPGLSRQVPWRARMKATMAMFANFTTAIATNSNSRARRSRESEKGGERSSRPPEREEAKGREMGRRVIFGARSKKPNPAWPDPILINTHI
ncbi:hypothetical protein NL676_012106 [Syzygium grande]|nr:hypothetical protein NL676_012106 [Syzygium grande]